MDYNDSLWDTALDELRKELDMADYSISFGTNELNVKQTGTLKSHRMIKRHDRLGGTPPEQIKLIAGSVADGAIKMVETTVGWPDVISTYDEFEVTVSIKGKKKKNASNQSGGTLGDITGYFDPTADLELDIPDADEWTPGIL